MAHQQVSWIWFKYFLKASFQNLYIYYWKIILSNFCPSGNRSRILSHNNTEIPVFPFHIVLYSKIASFIPGWFLVLVERKREVKDKYGYRVSSVLSIIEEGKWAKQIQFCRPFSNKLFDFIQTTRVNLKKQTFKLFPVSITRYK